QLIHQRVSIDRAKDDFGRVDFDRAYGTYGRVGGRLSRQLATKQGEQATEWARAYVWQQLGADAKTTFSTLQGENRVSLDTSLGGTWGQAGVGVSGQLSKRVSVFASAD